MTRRAILAGGIAATVAAGAVPARASPPMARRFMTPLLFVDTSLPDAAALAQLWQPILGSRLVRYSHDITAAWYDHLHGTPDENWPVVAGLTTADSAFCMKKLAQGNRLRVVLDEEAGWHRRDSAIRRWIIDRAGTNRPAALA